MRVKFVVSHLLGIVIHTNMQAKSAASPPRVNSTLVFRGNLLGETILQQVLIEVDAEHLGLKAMCLSKISDSTHTPPPCVKVE